MELHDLSTSPLLELEGEQKTASTLSANIAPSAVAKRVKSVRISAGGAIDRVEFEYTDGSKWSMGGPGGWKGIPPLVLADDEYLEEVRHEALPQWWYVGASIEFRTNKGRIFRHVGGFGAGEDEYMTTFKARPGYCISALKLYNGVLEGIAEAASHVPEDASLGMFMVYWIERGAGGQGATLEVKCDKGHIMIADRERAGHICDECSRRGTMSRCGGGCDYDLCAVCYRHHAEGWRSAVQSKGFQSREGAHRFADRQGAAARAELHAGPLRIELDDHPWLDGIRELREACWQCLRAAGSVVYTTTEPPANDLMIAEEYAGLLEEGNRRRANVVLDCAGLVVNVQKGTQVRAWGSSARLAMCRKAAADAGEFNLLEWERKSSSIKALLQSVRKSGPLLFRVLSLLNWRDDLKSTLVVGFCIIIQSACDGWQPVLTGAIFNLINGDKHEVERESRFLHWLCSWTWGCTGRLPLAKSVILALMLVACVQGLAKAFTNSVKKAMRDRQSQTLRTSMFEHLLAQDQTTYDILSKRDLVGKAELRAMDEVTEWVWNLTSQMVRLGTQLVFLFAISPVMTLIYVLLLPSIEKLVRNAMEKGLRAQQRREQGFDYMRHGVIHEAVGMIRTVKTFSREDQHVALVSLAAGGVAADGIGSKDRKREMRQGAVTLFNDISHKAVYCICLWCGLVWMEREFSAGDMTAYLLLVQQLGGLVDKVRWQFWELQRRHDSLQEHFDFMDKEPKLVPGDHRADVKGQVEFDEVHFSYPARPDSVVLKGVSFVMRQGEMTALVGASGSGKSTIASLLFRYYDPEPGCITVDGVSLRDWNTSHLHSQMALVAQQPLLFDTSIRNNLTYGLRRKVSDCEVEEAAKIANAHEFIQGFPAGYDTYVGDQGAHISGGQKQRLSIARAVIMRPQILVLDEATSALDAEAEGVVQDALDTVMVGRTTLVIAHRLSTIKNAHQIVCLRDGRVVEIGSPSDLLERRGYYWSLVRRQVCTLDDLSGFNLEIDQSIVDQPKAASKEESAESDSPMAAPQSSIEEIRASPSPPDEAEEEVLWADPIEGDMPGTSTWNSSTQNSEQELKDM